MKKLIWTAVALAIAATTACNHRAAAGSNDVAAAAAIDTVEAAGAAAEADSLTFAFVGDVMMGTTYPERELTADDGAGIFNDVKALLRGADVAAANLEGVLLDGPGKPKQCADPSKCFTFKMPERYAAHLTDAGIDFVSVANNHAADFGAPGKESTRRVLADAGIAYAGQRGSCPTAVIERRGVKIGFAAFGHSDGTPSVLDYGEVRRTVEGLDSVCDIVVVSFHGGAEGRRYNRVPGEMEMFLGEKRGDVKRFAHTAVDAGADIVYGHGPHVTRGMELYRDRLIMYSLGNFATPYGMNLKDINSHAPVVTVTTDADGRFRDGRVHSFVQTRGVGPRTDPSGAVAAKIAELSALDFPGNELAVGADGTLSRR